MGNGAQLFDPVLAEIRSLGKVLAEQTVGVLVAAALPRTLRVAEVDLKTGIDAKLRVLGHLGALIPGQRATQVDWQAADRPCDGIPDGLGTVTGKSWSILDGLAGPVPLHARQVQEHGEAGRAFDQRADRRTAETENEVPLPMPRDCPVVDLCRAVAYHQSIGEKGLAAIARTFARQSESTARPKAGRELSLQRATTLDIKGLINRFVTDAHR